ncbi:hypothetical protein V492_04798, partial [Pseudogymnoascus sp. VKM F-4246]
TSSARQGRETDRQTD